MNKTKCPYCLKIIRTSFDEQCRVRRKELILRYIDKELKLSSYFKFLRRKGYTMGYRTFHRDIKEMVESELIKTKVIHKRSLGSHTLIELSRKV